MRYTEKTLARLSCCHCGQVFPVENASTKRIIEEGKVDPSGFVSYYIFQIGTYGSADLDLDEEAWVIHFRSMPCTPAGDRICTKGGIEAREIMLTCNRENLTLRQAAERFG